MTVETTLNYTHFLLIVVDAHVIMARTLILLQILLVDCVLEIVVVNLVARLFVPTAELAKVGQHFTRFVFDSI